MLWAQGGVKHRVEGLLFRANSKYGSRFRVESLGFMVDEVSGFGSKDEGLAWSQINIQGCLKGLEFGTQSLMMRV